MIIYIDADATPKSVLAITQRVSNEFGAELVTVSSINHLIDGPNHVQVGAESQATDMEIVRRIDNRQKTVVVTQDYGLAALALAKNAKAVSPTGRVFTTENIDLLLSERAFHAKLRRGGKVRVRGPRARSNADDVAFEDALRLVIGQLIP